MITEEILHQAKEAEEEVTLKKDDDTRLDVNCQGDVLDLSVSDSDDHSLTPLISNSGDENPDICESVDENPDVSERSSHSSVGAVSLLPNDSYVSSSSSLSSASSPSSISSTSSSRKRSFNPDEFFLPDVPLSIGSGKTKNWCSRCEQGHFCLDFPRVRSEIRKIRKFFERNDKNKLEKLGRYLPANSSNWKVSQLLMVISDREIISDELSNFFHQFFSENHGATRRLMNNLSSDCFTTKKKKI